MTPADIHSYNLLYWMLAFASMTIFMLDVVNTVGTVIRL